MWIVARHIPMRRCKSMRTQCAFSAKSARKRVRAAFRSARTTFSMERKWALTPKRMRHCPSATTELQRRREKWRCLSFRISISRCVSRGYSGRTDRALWTKSSSAHAPRKAWRPSVIRSQCRLIRSTPRICCDRCFFKSRLVDCSISATVGNARGKSMGSSRSIALWRPGWS